MNDIISTAVAGMSASTARFQSAAYRIARKPETDLAGALVEAKLASLAFRANVAVVKAADEMLKSTLDILA